MTAEGRFEPRQATEILEHAVELVSKLAEPDRAASEIEILEKLATLNAVLMCDQRAIEVYEALAVRAAHQGLIDVEVRALVEMAWPLSWISRQRSLEVLERALSMSARQDDPILRARTRARCFALRLWQAWNPQDVEEFNKAFAILKAERHPMLAAELADRGFVSWISSEYREAHRCLIESRVNLFETVQHAPYLNRRYLRGQCVLTSSLLFLGEWGEALRECENLIAVLDKNAADYWVRTLQLIRAWVLLHAMDFAGVLAICSSIHPGEENHESRPALEYPTPHRFEFWMSRFLTGSAQTALGNCEGALENLMVAREHVDRQAVDWYWRMPLERALTELWLAKGDLTQARPQAEKFLSIALATAEHTWQALAWEVSARVALEELDLTRARCFIAKSLSSMEGYEVPLAAWRVHRTAAELFKRVGSKELAERHLALSRDTIMKLANSMSAEELRRQTFLSAPVIRAILVEREDPKLLAKEA